MKKISSIFIAFLILIFSANVVRAANSYTLEEIAAHASSTDCWMAISGNVYNVTDYLPIHNREFNIIAWCGTDATNDYNTKAGRGQNHSLKAQELLANYQIGTLSGLQGDAVTSTAAANVVAARTVKNYNVFVPFLVTIILYFLSMKLLAKPKHDFIWNSLMLLGLIPSFGFGMLMAMGLVPSGLLYLHVELSIIFGVSCILHFLYRFKMYFSEMQFTLRKKKKVI